MVMIIEDNKDSRELLEWILTDAYFEVRSFSTAESGLESLKVEEYEMIFMDIELPGMNGKDATACIRQMASYKKTPIIAVTAHGMGPETQRILDSGCNRIIHKPVDEDQLVKTLATCF